MGRITIYISDIHFGKGDRTSERAKEADLIQCLKAHRTTCDRLVLLGDIFDEYIEYKHLVPKGCVRFLGVLAELVDEGMNITYVVGNHDPWHIDFFRDEIGVRVVDGPITEQHFGLNVYAAHGDEIIQPTSFLHRLRPLMRHPVPTRMYRSLLPGDAGFGLARWVNRRFGTKEIKPEHAALQRSKAMEVLANPSADIVVMGHCHVPEFTVTADGTYMNLGSWHHLRTFGTMDAHGPRLLQWKNKASTAFSPETNAVQSLLGAE